MYQFSSEERQILRDKGRNNPSILYRLRELCREVYGQKRLVPNLMTVPGGIGLITCQRIRCIQCNELLKVIKRKNRGFALIAKPLLVRN